MTDDTIYGSSPIGRRLDGMMKDDDRILAVRGTRIARAATRILFAALLILEAGLAPSEPAKQIVLVLDCEASGQNQASAARAATPIIVDAVASSGTYSAVSPESRDRALREIAFSLTDLANAPLRERIGALTSAGFVLASRIERGEGELMLSMQLIDVETGTIVGSATEPYRSVGTLIDGAAAQALRCLGIQGPDSGDGALRVKNAVELIKAIGPDRIIRLAPGRYDLTGMFTIKNRYVEWIDEFDGPCPVVKNLSGLALVGEEGAEIVISPAYGWVLSFETCSGIRISGLTIGHTKPGYCLGGVLSFTRCDDVEIRSCDLYGSGTYGLGLDRTEKFSMADSTVRDCTYGLATVERCEDLAFDSTVFEGTGEFDLFSVTASTHLLFNDCDFSRNRGDCLFSIDAESRDCRTVSCRFLDNRVARFSGGATPPSLEDAVFARNAFKRP
jgi:hypothetical protein